MSEQVVKEDKKLTFVEKILRDLAPGQDGEMKMTRWLTQS